MRTARVRFFIGAVLSAALMLDHLGEPGGAADLDAAVSAVLGAGAPETTADWDDALQDALSAAPTAGAAAR